MAHTETQSIEIDVNQIDASELNPRKEFDAAALEELALSLAETGLIQPVLVRPRGDRWQLLAGERRWRAAQLAGMERIPARVRDVADDAEALAIALAENLQREDLTAIEEARAYQRLAEIGWTQTQIAKRMGKAQPTVANALRLLNLPESVQAHVQAGHLAPAAARALLPLAGFPRACEAMAQRVITREIPTRILERDVFGTHEWELARDGITRALDHRTPWDWRTVCRESCPHGAYRDSSDPTAGICLRPDHYEELEREAAALPAPPVVTVDLIPDREADRAAREELWQACRQLMDGGKVNADRRMMAALCVDLITAAKHETLKLMASTEGVPDALLEQLLTAEPTRQGIAQALSGYNAAFVARLALLCLLRTEAEEAAHLRHPPRLAEWLTGCSLAGKPERDSRPFVRICMACGATQHEKPRAEQWVTGTRCAECATSVEEAPAA